MRVLAVRPGPHFSVLDVHNGWVNALRSFGIVVEEFQLDDRLDFFASALLEKDGEVRNAFDYESSVRLAANGLKEVCYDFWPDVILVTSGFFIPPEFYKVFRARGHKLAVLFTESPYEDDKQIARAGLFDLVLINDPTNLETFRTQNPKTFYVPHAYDPAVHRPGPGLPEFACDFGFVGTGYPSREEFLTGCDFEGLSVKIGGNWRESGPWIRDRLVHPVEFCLDNPETVALYQSARASLNLYRKEASADHLVDGWAMGPREVELAACGTFFLREPRGEGDEVFPFLPTVTDPAEVRPLLDWWFAHDKERGEAVRQAGEAIADRTFQNHAAQFLNLI